MAAIDAQNVHHIEFEAPLSADSQPGSIEARHFSIELTLELERQLEMDSFPPTPAHTRDVDTRPRAGSMKLESLDPHVLAHIVMQLRQSLADMTKERDSSREMLVTAHSHGADLKDALQLMTEKNTRMESELSDTRRKIRDDEEAITMLRSKVEESRRGLMRLQKESRRQSMAPMTIDLNRAGLASFSSPPSAKRGSFSPLTGTLAARPGVGHRRISSVSDLGGEMGPNLQFVPIPDTASIHSYNSATSRRVSGLLGRTTPPQLDLSQHDSLVAAVDALRKEVRTITHELKATKNDLSDSNEAREASETCVKALREFIEENNIGTPNTMNGLESLKLPTPPTMASGEDDSSKKPTSAVAGWGFKLWKDATLRTPTIPHSATFSAPTATPPPVAGPISATPLSRKFGGFFGSRGSVSSITSTMSSDQATAPAAPQVQMDATAASASRNTHRDSNYSTSDVSSMAEPISPTSEVNGSVIVRDAANSSESGSAGASPELLAKRMQGDGEQQENLVVG